MTSIGKAVFFVIVLSLAYRAEDARAAITRDQAETAALELVPGGTLLSGSLERSRGRWTWWFDVSIPRSKNVQAIQIDALTGAVVSNTTESPFDR